MITLKDIAKEAKKAACLFLQDEGSLEFAGLALYFGTEASYVIMPEGFMTAGYLTDKVKELAKETALVTFGVKEFYSHIGLHEVCQTEGKQLHDVKMAMYLLNPVKSAYHVEELARE